MKWNTVLAILAMVGAFGLSGCSKDLSGTWTGNITFSQQLGGSQSENITMQLIDNGDQITATFVSGGGSGSFSGNKNGDQVTVSNMTYNDNFTSSVNPDGSGPIGGSTSYCPGTYTGTCTFNDNTGSCVFNGQGGSTGGIFATQPCSAQASFTQQDGSAE